MKFDSEVLYIHLKRLAAAMPDLASQTLGTSDTYQWLGRAVALIEATQDSSDAIQMRILSDGLETGSEEYRKHCEKKIASIVHRALARAELNAPASAQGAFIAAGDTFTAFAAVAQVLARAKTDILIVDAYADHVIMTDFAIAAPVGVSLRILGANKESRKLALKAAGDRWIAQYGPDRPLGLRVAPAAHLHDRLILIDRVEAWFAGQSFNGMAQRSHTSIERSDDELAAMKVQAYEALWRSAELLTTP